MADVKPPRHTGGERETLQALLQYQRDSFVRKVAGLTDADARRAPVPSGTSLLWLVKHMARAEELWFVRRFGGVVVDLPDEELTPGDTLASAVERYRVAWARADAVVAAAADLDELCRDVGSEAPVNLRWALAHLLEETARHAGHADILRELVDGRTGR